MTVVVWTPKGMAADSMMTRGDTIYFVKKLFRVGGKVVGLAGGSDYCTAWLAWYTAGADPEKYPTTQKEEDCAVTMVGDKDSCVLYDRTPYPVEVFQPYAAIGSGREVALGALSQGASAVAAAHSACQWVIGCGGCISTESFE